MESDVGETKPRRVRQYPNSAAGPFLVIAESKDGVNLSPSTVSKKLIRLYGDQYVKAIPQSKRRMKILMGTAGSANNLVTRKSANLTFTIPQRLVEVLGVTHVDLEVDDEELYAATPFDKTKALQTNCDEILEIRRVLKKSGDEEIPLTTVIVTFAGQKLPTHIEINKVLYGVKPYIYPTRQCKK